MQIHQAALDRVRNARMRGEGTATIFEQMAFSVAQFGAAASELNITYQRPDDIVSDGDLFPYITLSLRPATDEPQPRTENGDDQR